MTVNTPHEKVSSVDHLKRRFGKLGIQIEITEPCLNADKASKGLVTPVGAKEMLPVARATVFNTCAIQESHGSCKTEYNRTRSKGGFAYSEEKLYKCWRPVHTLNLKKALRRKCPSIVSLQKQSELVWKSDAGKIVQLGLLIFRVTLRSRSSRETNVCMVVSSKSFGDLHMNQVRQFLLSNQKADGFLWEVIRFNQGNCKVYNYNFATKSWNEV